MPISQSKDSGMIILVSPKYLISLGNHFDLQRLRKGKAMTLFLYLQLRNCSEPDWTCDVRSVTVQLKTPI